MLATVQYGLYAPSGGEIDHLHGHSKRYIAVYTALSRKWRSKWLLQRLLAIRVLLLNGLVAIRLGLPPRTGGCKHGDIQMASSYQISQ